MRPFKVLFSFFVFLTLHYSTLAQLVSVNDGCAPLTVNYTAPGGVASFFWDLGNGVTSNLESPTNSYVTPGTYIVRFRLTPNGPDLATDTVRVYEKPVVSFEGDPRSGCVPLAVNFSSTSTIDPNIAITSYAWTFGDGQAGTGLTTAHTYNSPGNFKVALNIVSSMENCSSFAEELDYIQTSQRPNTRFSTTPNPPLACTPPLVVNFTNNSGSTNPLTYSWDFGNGNTSTNQNPGAQTYTQVGNYPVTLTATDDLGCSNDFRVTVSVGSPTASFVAPDTVCAGTPVRIVNNSSAGVYFWNFGTGADPERSGDFNPVVIFNGEGPRNISLTVTDPTGTCTGDTLVSIYVDLVDAAFESDPGYSCNTPQQFTFTPLSSEPDSFVWIYNDLSETHDPIGSYTYPRDTSTYGKNGFTQLLTTLTVFNSRGCKGFFQKYDTIYPPNALFAPDTTMGCAPLTVEFIDHSTSNEDIVSWTYVWGDNTSNTYTTSDPQTHTFTQPGEYPVILIIENAAGCRDTSYAIVIEVGGPIAPDFTVDNSNICPGDSVVFSDLTNDPNIDAWHFSTDGDRLQHCADIPSTAYAFISETGAMDVTLTVLYNGCESQVTKSNLITVNGPIAEIGYKIECESPFDVTFEDKSHEASNVRWYFGDGDSTDLRNPVHTYPATGDYQVVLVASNSATGCADSRDTVMVHIREIKASFNLEEQYCSGTPFDLDATLSQDVNATCWKGYTWFFSDKRPITTQDSIIETQFGPAGKNWARLVVEDINGCRDTLSDTTMIYLVEALFEVSDDTICAGQTINFTDLSTGNANLVSWEWSFGDNNTSTAQNPSYTYPAPPLSGVFSVTLTAKDEFNCPGEFTREIYFYEPVSNISISDLELCTGDEIIFEGSDFTSQGSFLNYTWTLDGNFVSNQRRDTLQFNNAGTFRLLLNFEEDATGCLGDNFVDIAVQDYPDAAFSSGIDGNAENCAGQNVTFTTNSTAPGIAYTWNMGDGTVIPPSGNVGIVDYSFNKGTFTVEVLAETTFGCKDTFERTYVFVSPEGNLTASPARICAGESVSFEATNLVDVNNFSIEFGDGSSVANQSPTSHTYPNGGTFNATLILELEIANATCRASDVVPITVLDPAATIETNKNVYCPTDTVRFITSNVRDADIFIWNFGDNRGTSTNPNPRYKYSQAGIYEVTLIIENSELGCRDTIFETIDVTGDLGLSLTVEKTTLCAGETIGISVNNPQSDWLYIWSPSSITPPNSPIVEFTPGQSTTVSVIVQDANQCTDTARVAITVVPPFDFEGDSIAILVQEGATNFPLPALPDAVNGLNIDWNPKGGLNLDNLLQPIVNAAPGDSLIYIANVSDANGCNFEEFIRLIRIFKVPNVFTPNGDGKNDLFNVEAAGGGINRNDIVRFVIYNRWGQKVYDNDNPTLGWDGTFNGTPQPSDVYVFVVEVNLANGTSTVVSGDVTLLR